MSDTTDDVEFWGHQLLRKSQSASIRTEMKEYLSERELEDDFKALRREASTGIDLSEYIDEGREDRL
jgi:hypothetical protein